MMEKHSTSSALRVRRGEGKRPGAVVVGGDYQGLGIVRSLGRRGVSVCVVDDEYSIARFSRYARHAERVPDLRDEQRAVETLLDLGRRLGLEGWVLFPTRDETVAALSRHRAELKKIFRVPTPDWETVRWAWDKRNTYRLATELGVPTPRQWCPLGIDELRMIEASFPLVIKPAIKERFIYATGDKAWRADTSTELERRFRDALTLMKPGEVMVQELIPGDGYQQLACCAFFKDGQAVGRLVARRRRQHPPEFGRASTYVETIDNPLLEELSERFLRRISYYGLVELEYKRDERDGQYKLLDVNARTWGYHSIGTRAGVDFPYLVFADQVGESVAACRARPGVRWIRLATDVPTSVLEIMRGRLSLRAYTRSLRSWHVESVFSREDLVPALAEVALLPYLFVKRGY